MSQEQRPHDAVSEKIRTKPDLVLQFVQDITDKLTLSKIAAVFLFGVLGTFLTLVYENRSSVFDSALSVWRGEKEHTNWELSDSTKAQMVGTVKASSWINFILISEVDLQKNRRIPKYWFMDPAAEVLIENKSALLQSQPVFDLDAKNTQQMIGILNNEFVCSPFEDTIFSKMFPNLQKEIPYVCRLSIPPFYGRFVGILTIGLRKQPSKDELEQIRIDLARFSVEVYLRDVTKKSDSLLIQGH